MMTTDGQIENGIGDRLNSTTGVPEAKAEGNAPRLKKATSGVRGLYKRDDTWYCRMADMNGRIIRKKLSKDKATAITILAEMRKTIDLQKAGILPDYYVRKVKLVSDLWDRYIANIKAGQRSGNTIDSCLTAYQQVIVKNGFKYVTDIKIEAINKWSTRRLREGTRGQTVNLYIGIVRRALQWALDNGMTTHNPLANWHTVRANEPCKRRNFQPEEVAAILDAEENPEWRLRWLVYFYTGLRTDAGASLKWEWIDFDAKALNIPVEHNKSRRQLSIPLHPDLLQALQIQRLYTGRNSGEVFELRHYDAIRNRFRKICEKAGLDMEGVTLHSMRHTTATMLYEASGRDVKVVQELLGHSAPTTTMRYLHLTAEAKRSAVLNLDFGKGSLGLQPEKTPEVIPFPAAAMA